MSGKQPMVYAYFRFYADDNDIVNGLKPFCTDIIRLSNSGYNYKEYRCWVDNAGGLESWIGTQHGYITSERETGFLDAAPSDSIYDNTIVMGKQKLLLDDLRYLHVFKPPTPSQPRPATRSYPIPPITLLLSEHPPKIAKVIPQKSHAASIGNMATKQSDCVCTYSSSVSDY